MSGRNCYSSNKNFLYENLIPIGCFLIQLLIILCSFSISDRKFAGKFKFQNLMGSLIKFSKFPSLDEQRSLHYDRDPLFFFINSEESRR